MMSMRAAFVITPLTRACIVRLVNRSGSLNVLTQELELFGDEPTLACQDKL